MAKVNELSCVAFQANTGQGQCKLDFTFEGVVQVPSGKRFTQAEVDNLAQTLTALVIADNKANRAYPFPKLIGYEKSGGDPVRVEFDNGASITTFENLLTLTGKFYSGLHASNALRSRNKQDLSILVFGGGYVFGALIGGEYAGIPYGNFFCRGVEPAAFKIEAKYMFDGIVDPKYINEQLWFVNDDNGSVADLSGLYDVVLKETTPMTALGLATLSVKRLNGELDLVASNATELTAIPFAQWSAKNAITGLAIPITAAAVAGANYTIDLDSTSPNYTAVPVGGLIEITGPTVSQLTTAGILKSEINTFTVKKVV